MYQTQRRTCQPRKRVVTISQAAIDEAREAGTCCIAQ